MKKIKFVTLSYSMAKSGTTLGKSLCPQSTGVVFSWRTRLPGEESINFQGGASPQALYNMDTFRTMKRSVLFTYLKSRGL